MAVSAQLTRGVSQLYLFLTQVSGCRDQQLRRVVTFPCRLNTVGRCYVSPLSFFDKKYQTPLAKMVILKTDHKRSNKSLWSILVPMCCKISLFYERLGISKEHLCTQKKSNLYLKKQDFIVVANKG